LNRQWRQGIVALVAYAGGIDGSVRGNGDRGDFAAGRLKENIAFFL